jgi:hypothetical protein
MARLIFISALLLFTACKKESRAIEHNVQFSSNITDPQYYSISINGVSGNDIGQTYTVDGNSDIALTLYAAGGDTTYVNEGDSLWTRGGITVDGKTVAGYNGYGNTVLSYHIQ